MEELINNVIMNKTGVNPDQENYFQKCGKYRDQRDNRENWKNRTSMTGDKTTRKTRENRDYFGLRESINYNNHQ